MGATISDERGMDSCVMKLDWTDGGCGEVRARVRGRGGAGVVGGDCNVCRC
ncbi:hypothetical protein E2C01_078066 [Portunus trituberculatus]|uniref:Uncharacterized protein n=1 Tax=Portunus trituberculatus TaxID=210409 RepID=A0A5B7IP13_PORTR|nr:hypothetical protein [Portunus trituberculatus]